MDLDLGAGQCPHLENAVGWALYALEPAEEHTIRLHLPTCPPCRAAVRETEQVSAALGAAVVQHEPRPGSRERLLAAIQHAPRVSLQPLPPPVPIDSARRTRPARGRRLLVAAAAVVVALGAATIVLGVQVDHLSSQQRAQAAGEALVQSIVGDPAAKRAVLTNAAGKPAAMLITSSVGAVVVPLGLPTNAASQQYVAWGLQESGPVALASFDVPVGGVGPIVVNLPSLARDLNRFAISLEPGRIMPAKPTTVIASGAV